MNGPVCPQNKVINDEKLLNFASCHCQFKYYGSLGTMLPSCPGKK